MENVVSDSEEKFTHLPFLKIKIRDNISFENNIKETSNEIRSQTFRLLEGYETDKLKKKIIKNESIKNNNNNNDNSEEIANNKYNLIDINKKIIYNNNNFMKNKKIKNYKFVSIRDKYLALLKKYQFKSINRQIENNDGSSPKIILSNSNTSNSNKLIKKNFSNKIINPFTNINDKLNNTIENEFNNQNSNIFKIEKTLYETQLNSKDIIENIKKYNKIKKKKGPNIKSYINKSAKSLKRFEKIMFAKNKDKKEEKKINKISKINYYKLFDPINKANNCPLKKIKLSKKSDSNSVWIKRSTANLLIFGQSFQLMDDSQFFKQRKKIMEDYPILVKEANNIKIKEKDKEWKQNHFGDNLKKNNRIINQLVENNLTLYKNVYRKVNDD